MRNIRSIATKAEIEKILDGFKVSAEPVNTKFAVMAYLGMCRHPYMSAEWLIAQFVWEESIIKIGEYLGEDSATIIKDRIEHLYQQEGYFHKTYHTIDKKAA